MPYAARTDVVSLMGDASVAIVWDLNDDGTEDAGALDADRQRADDYINLFLASNGVALPVSTTGMTTLAATTVTNSLTNIGAHLTRLHGYSHRNMEAWATRLGKPAADVRAEFDDDKAYADEQLGRLLTTLQNASPTDTNVAAGTFQFIPRVNADYATATDEFNRPARFLPGIG